MPAISTNTIGAIYQQLSGELAAAGIEEPRLEARMLMSFAAGIDQSRILGYPEDEIAVKSLAELSKFAARRKSGEPIAYITGQKEFWSLNFKVSRETLIPRPDSETLIEAVLGELPDKNASLKILDLGTGTGCLLLALLSELPNALGLGVDSNPKTCDIARDNANQLGLVSRVTIQQRDWLTGLNGNFNIIISNPPYIVESEIAALEPDVNQFEPHLALSGGADGLAAYHLIATQCSAHLTPDGFLAVECGMGQIPDIKGIFLKNNLKIKSIHRDIANVERCILATV
ncbi:MAG: peptide chain release factor N(5)-glutamine methyltransferase [Rhodospirillales bacterium]|jgi:release factor glutamine methyltransferase|nr:peptide chain release factor N(5)-glutamine methyltransferase [Rhodospirillales bacterium]